MDLRGCFAAGGKRENMQFSAAAAAGGYGKGPLYGNTFARANASAAGKGEGRA